MTQQQLAQSNGHTVRRDVTRRTILFYCILLGIGITLVLVLLEACVLLLLNPAHLLGTTGNRFSALFALPIHIPLLLVGIVIELLAVLVLIVLAAKPFSLLLYVRTVHRTQEEHHTLYTPLTALTNIRKTEDTFSQHTPAIEPASTSLQEKQVSINDLAEQDAHQMILGVPGAGKTTMLHVYQYTKSQRPLRMVLRKQKLPVYIPMKNYSLFLKKRQGVPTGMLTLTPEATEVAQATLLDFLSETDLPGMPYLRPYLYQLAQQGRLLLLCDGLNEVDSNYLTQIDQELVHFMRDTHNRVVMTCREVDYNEQDDFRQLVEDGQASRSVIYPLQPEQVHEFVERYVERQDKHWQHTAGQIMQVIDRSRLRYHCTNPMMLFTLMEIIDKIGVERGKQIDTRGRLLREWVKQGILREQQQPKWSKNAPAEQEIIRFLSEVACAARWANDRNAIQLRISAPISVSGEAGYAAIHFDELADELQVWLDEHPALSPFVGDDDHEPLYEPYSDLAQLLQFALSANLIDVSSGGVLSFRHELIAEYFVAEYFVASANKQGLSAALIREELLDNVGRWSEPVAIWAGLLDTPLVLAERFGVLGSKHPAYVLQALALSLVCVGVLWTPPQAEVQRSVTLPSHVAESLAIAVRNKAAREELASIFTRCAEEGGQEVYRSLLPLIMVEGVDELLTLLDKNIVPELLFTYLQETADNVAYETQVKRLTQVLGRFGTVVVDRAVQLSQPAPERSIRLRAAVINVLGSTKEPRAVEPLIARMSDADMHIVGRAASALAHLGPELTLAPVLRELENRSSPIRVHRAALFILKHFLEEQDVRHHLTFLQYQNVLDKVVPVLTSNYQAEPEVQQLAREILVHQGRTAATDGQENRAEKVIEMLARYLSSQNEVVVRNVILALQEIGTLATPRLLDMLKTPTETLTIRIIDILNVTHDLRALPYLLHLVSNPAPQMQQQVAQVLQTYAPESVPGLIDIVLTIPDELIAERAAHILGDIGEPSVEPIMAAFTRIVPERTRLLVQVLERIRDPQSIPALITLLQSSQLESLLTIATIRALSEFPEKRVVPPLLRVISEVNPAQVYEEAIDALSLLGEVALDALFTGLNGYEETPTLQRIRRAILGMKPFPGEWLINALVSSSDAQAQHILYMFKLHGADAAQVLVRHLLHSDERVRGYIQNALNAMPGAIVVPALLEVLNQSLALRKAASALLLRYPDAAISPLVELLGEHERGEAAATILPQFGPRVLRPLVSGLNDQRSAARERAQHIIVSLVQQSTDEHASLLEIVHLFNPAPPTQARDALIAVLTNELAGSSVPALLEGLEDAHLINNASDALVILSRKATHHNLVIGSLLQALYIEERRGGAETALIKIGASVVPVVGDLIDDPHPFVATSARRILRDIGVPALPFIWKAYSDTSDSTRREAALEVFHGMRTEVIKDELIELLTSDTQTDIAMAISLLLDRIQDESTQHYADRVMVPELLEYVQTHNDEEINLRVISLLLLLGERTLIDPLLQTLDEYPQHRRQLAYVFLLLGEEAQNALLEMFKDAETSPELRSEVAALLAMMSAPDAITEYAQHVSNYGVATTRTSVLFPEQLAVALHALGGLLASGQWNVRRLQELRDASKEGSAAHELFNVLLGWRYEPQLAKLQNDLETERNTHKKEMLVLTAKIMQSERRASSLESELEEVQREHGNRGDELFRITRERDSLRVRLEQAVQENHALRSQVARINPANSQRRP